MSTEIPSIETLLRINESANRRLHTIIRANAKKSSCYLVDSEDKEINAMPISYPRVLDVPIRTDIHNLSLGERCYWFSDNGDSGFNQGYLTLPEVGLVLGKDYTVAGHDVSDIHAMLKANSEGPGKANAYVLGEVYSGGSITTGYVVIPVQFYKISDKRHRELGITSPTNSEVWKTNLRARIANVERERVNPMLVRRL